MTVTYTVPNVNRVPIRALAEFPKPQQHRDGIKLFTSQPHLWHLQNPW